MKLPSETLKALQIAARAAEDKQATRVAAYGVAETVGLADAYFVASGESERQVNAIVEEIEDCLREEMDLKPFRREGRSQGRWVLLDFGDIVVNVQHVEDREFYALDRLWGNSPAIDLSQALEEQPESGDSQAQARSHGSHALPRPVV